VATFKVGVRGVNLTVLKLIAQVIRAKAVSSIMTTSQAVSAIAKGVTLFNVVASLATPITYLAIVFAPGMYGAVMNSDLSPSSSLALEVGGLVHVAIDATVYMGNGIGGSESF